MDLGREEVDALLDKYTGRPVIGILMSLEKGATARVSGSLGVANDHGKGWLAIRDNSDNAIQLCVEDCMFRYLDPREAPAFLRETAEQTFEGVLCIVHVPLSISLAIFTIKSS